MYVQTSHMDIDTCFRGDSLMSCPADALAFKFLIKPVASVIVAEEKVTEFDSWFIRFEYVLHEIGSLYSAVPTLTKSYCCN